MYIPDKEWDLIVSDCLNLVEVIEEIPSIVVYPNKQEILAVLYDLIHMEDKPVPRKRSKKKRMLKKIK